jgi:CRP/FNR family transcriptional regulator
MEPVSFKSLFPDITSKALFEEIEKNSKLKSFEDGDIIIDKGMPINNIPLLLTGNIKVIREDEEGRELLMYFLSPGESCTMSLTCCMANQQSEIRAIAEGKVTILAIPVHFMDEWMLKYADWKNFVMNTYRIRFEELLNTVDQIAFKKMDERLEKYLLNHSKLKNSEKISITHQAIANDLNSSREVISRLLKQLEKQGRIKLSRHCIDVGELVRVNKAY